MGAVTAMVDNTGEGAEQGSRWPIHHPSICPLMLSVPPEYPLPLPQDGS